MSIADCLFAQSVQNILFPRYRLPKLTGLVAVLEKCIPACRKLVGVPSP